MSDKHKKPKFDARFARRRARWLEEELQLAGGLVVPPDAVIADVTQQVANNSYDSPPAYYVDKEFTCVDCGRKEVWTAP